MVRFHEASVLLVAFLLALPGAAATASAPSPHHLQATYNGSTGTVSLNWTGPNRPNTSYLVWQDATFLNTTASTSLLTHLDGTASGYLYFVSTSWPNRTVSVPAVVAVPTISCEIVTVQTSWSYPYLSARLHEECLGGTVVYDKSVTWTAPA